MLISDNLYCFLVTQQHMNVINYHCAEGNNYHFPKYSRRDTGQFM